MRFVRKLAALSLVTSVVVSAWAEAPVPVTGTMQALFSPQDNIEASILEEVDGARRQILVQAYLLTSKKLAQALSDARRRGLEVAVLLDQSQVARTGDTAARLLSDAGAGVWLETEYENAHNKLVIIDAGTDHATVITGSYNFTWTAQHRNAENVLIVRNNPVLVARYAANWERHREQAVPYKK